MRPTDDTVPQTGPGIPDTPGERRLSPDDLTASEADRRAEALIRRGWAGACGHADDTEAHPS
jgi:hypothetical protein